MQTYGQYAQDIIDLVNGDLTADGVITGEFIRNYLANKAEGDARTEAVFGLLEAGDHHGHDHGHDFDATDIDEAPVKAPVSADEAMFQRAMALKLKAPERMIRDYDMPELHALFVDKARFQKALTDSLPRVDPKFYHDRLNRISGTYIEDLLINDEVKLAAEYIDPSNEMTATDMRKALSPASWSTKYAMKKENDRMKLLGQHCLYLGEFADDAGLYGLAKEMKGSGLSREEIRKLLAQRILQGALEHEVGHTLGLRHNFSGSTDVFNFFDEYYSIREKELILCQSPTWCDDDAGETCAFKTCNADGDCPAGTLCNGTTCAAPSAAGTGLVATGTCAKAVPDTSTCTPDDDNFACGQGNYCDEGRCYQPAGQFAPRPRMTDAERASKRTEYQYSTVMDYGGRIKRAQPRQVRLRRHQVRLHAARRHLRRHLTPRRAHRARRRPRRLHADQRDLRPRLALVLDQSRRGLLPPVLLPLSNDIGRVEQNLKRTPTPYHTVRFQQNAVVNSARMYKDLTYVEVPYAYCSDEYRGNMGCYYFDQGIDMGEMAGSAMEQLSNYYIFDAFKRERLFYGSYGNPMGYYARIMDRYLRVMGDVGMYYALYNLLFRYSDYANWKSSPMGGRWSSPRSRPSTRCAT